MMYNYLATMRLHDTREGGRTMTVGPNRRVVFKGRISGGPDQRKDELKRVLKPLKGYWGSDGMTKNQERLERDPDRPLMSFMQFKTSVKILLTDAGMLLPVSTED